MTALTVVSFLLGCALWQLARKGWALRQARRNQIVIHLAADADLETATAAVESALDRRWGPREGGVGIAGGRDSAATSGPDREKNRAQKTDDDGFDDDLGAVFAAAKPPTSFDIPPDLGRPAGDEQTRPEKERPADRRETPVRDEREQSHTPKETKR